MSDPKKPYTFPEDDFTEEERTAHYAEEAEAAMRETAELVGHSERKSENEDRED